MKKYIKPIIIGAIGGFLPLIFGYNITMIGWWILMPICSIFVYLVWCMIIFISIFDHKIEK
jgi:hypothetical protein